MKLSISSVFTQFECYTQIFANIPFWFLLNCFERYFLSSNTVIRGSFGKNIFVTLTSHFHKFSYMSLLLASQHDDINAVGATEKIFYENELCIMQDKDKSKFMIFCFQNFTFSQFILSLHLHQWNIFNQFFNNELLVIIHVEVSGS